MKSKNKISKKIKSQEILIQKIDSLDNTIKNCFNAWMYIPARPQPPIKLIFATGVLFGLLMGLLWGVIR